MDEKESCELCFLKKKMAQNIRKHFRACQELLQSYTQMVEYTNDRKHAHLNTSFQSFAKSPHKFSGHFSKGTERKTLQKDIIPIEKGYQQSGAKPIDRRIKEQQSSAHKSVEKCSNTNKDFSVQIIKPDRKKLDQQIVLNNILTSETKEAPVDKKTLQILHEHPPNEPEQSHFQETLPNPPSLADTQAPPPLKKNNRRKKNDHPPSDQVSVNLKQKSTGRGRGRGRGRKPIEPKEKQNSKSKGKKRESKQKTVQSKQNKQHQQLPPPNNPQEEFSDVHCQLCDNDGSLLCCDKCPKAFHLKCVGLTAVPEDDWFCQHCRN